MVAAFLFVSLLAVLSCCSVLAQEHVVLGDFLDSLGCPGAASRNTTEMCSWTGVTCSPSGNVTKVNVGCPGGEFRPLGGLRALASLSLDIEDSLVLPKGSAALAALPPSLQVLDIDGGRVATFPPGFLAGASVLTELRLTSGTLESLPDDVPVSITLLDASDNGLRELPRNWDTWSLTSLFMSNSAMPRFPYPVSDDGDADCSGPPHLTYVWADSSGIGEVCDVFGSMVRVWSKGD